ncbi:MAG: radical SAM family heme chaperone HemW [Candidatus Acidulodesulfobacterium sp.]
MRDLSLYIHVPFCKSKCNYCNFYSISLTKLKKTYSSNLAELYPEFLIKEIGINAEKYHLENARINTVYLGGGTPSVMPVYFFSGLIEFIDKNFQIAKSAEITAEVNPESCDLEKLNGLKAIGFNRLSIGAQSFDDGVLKAAGRIHNKNDIYRAVGNAEKAGFENISLDLIIGLPGQSKKIFLDDINHIVDIAPEHISAYMLSIEKGSLFYNIYNGFPALEHLEFIDEEKIADYYIILCEILNGQFYEHYEISNFAKNGYESRHNINYWNRGEYLGLGPSASSFLKLENGKEIRKTNIPDLEKYISNILKENEGQSQKDEGFIEILTKKDKINEEIFLSLRTSSGINEKRLRGLAGGEIIDKFIKERLMQNFKGNISLTLKGMLLSSEIFARIMI